VSYIDPLDSYCGHRLLTEEELRRVAYNIQRTTGEQLRKMRPPPVVILDAKWARVVPVCIEELIVARQRIAEVAKLNTERAEMLAMLKELRAKLMEDDWYDDPRLVSVGDPSADLKCRASELIARIEGGAE
jgi:hypothetical protein